jgi:hypothetical protein
MLLVKRLIVRKVSFFEETWSEYTSALGKFIPESIRNRIFTRKTAYIAVAIVTIELIAVLSIYWLWFKNF